MVAWNVLATIRDGGARTALRMLAPFGDVRWSSYRNVLIMKVADVTGFLEGLQATLAEDASLANAVARVAPVTHTFRFASPEEFESKTRAIAGGWLPELGGKRFHVRMHRRGFKGSLSSQQEEQFLDRFVLARTAESGSVAVIDFADPDLVIAIETLGSDAGLARWTREQLARYELLRLD